MEEVLRVCEEVVSLVNPKKVILYGKKVYVHNGGIKNFDICVVMETDSPINSEKQIYLSIESALPFNVLVYTSKEWDELTSDPYSFASNILTNGTVVYEEA